MTTRRRILSLLAAAMPLCALGQSAPSPSALAPGQQPFFDPQQYPALKGQVDQFTLTPGGDIDGLILRDGTEVKTPKHLSTEIAYSVKPGDTVVVRGLRASVVPLVVAVSITDATTGRTVADTGRPLERLGAMAGAGYWFATATPGFVGTEGRIRMVLHGGRGEADGALLENGTVLRLAPGEAYRLSPVLRQGQNVVAEGIGFASALGRVMDVRLIGPARDQLTLVQAPPKKGKKDKRGRPGPEAGGVALGVPLPVAPPPPRP